MSSKTKKTSRLAMTGIVLALTSTTSAVAAGSAFAATTTATTSGTTSAASTKIYSTNSTSGSVVANLTKGSKLTGTISNGWMKISSPSTYSGKYVQVSSLTSMSTGTPPVTTTTTTTGRTYYSKTNIRSGPSTSTKIAGTVSPNTNFTGTVSNGWMKISSPSAYAGKYISMTVLTGVKTTTTSKPSTPAPKPSTTTPSKPATTPATVYKLNTPYTCTTNPTNMSTASADCVRAVQSALNSWIFRNNPKGAQALSVTGYYGSVTTTDVKAFQTTNKITATGQMDAATWKALAAASTAAPTNTTSPEKIIGADGDTHPAFPSTVRLPDGRLMIVFTSARKHMNNTTPSTTWKTYSSDGGYSWTKPEQIIFNNGMENTPAGLGVATSGPLAGHPILTTWSVKNGNVHTMVTTSLDTSGNTWGPLTDVSEAGSTYSASPIVQITDTDFQQAVYIYNHGGNGGTAQTIGLTYDGSRFIVGTAAVIASTTAQAQSGATRQPVPLADGASNDASQAVDTTGTFSETGMVKLKDGRLFAMIRNDTTAPQSPGIWQAYSSDNGKTWTKPTFSFIGSGAPRINVTSTGKLVILYRHINTVNGASTPSGSKDAVYRVSSDNGKTWGAEQSLGVHSDFEMAYGTPIDNSDGSVTFIWASETTSDKSNIVVTPNVAVK